MNMMRKRLISLNLAILMLLSLVLPAGRRSWANRQLCSRRSSRWHRPGNRRYRPRGRMRSL